MMSRSLSEIKLPSFSGLERLNIYNKFFHPNACHVCKMAIQENLKSCPECHMIAYCGEKHRMLHRSQHREICEAIRRMSKTRNLWHTRGFTSEEWVIFKKENIRIIGEHLHRELKSYEEQMFMFAKSCHTCHQQTNLVTTCKKCYCINSCADHSLLDFDHDCEGLLFSFILDIMYYRKECHIKSKLFDHKIDMPKFPIKIESFVESFDEDKDDKDDLENYCNWNSFNFFFCDWISDPLTVCQFIQNSTYSQLAKKKPFFNVHIVAGSNSTDDWPAWELLLHTLGDKVTLQITILGLELQSAYTPARTLCKTCTNLGKSLSIKWHNVSYEQYAQSSLHDQPDIIVGFDAEVAQFKDPAIEAMGNQTCPLLLTTRSEKQAKGNIKKLQEILNKYKKFYTIIYSENKFRSLRPRRDCESDWVTLRNKYLIICLNSNYTI